MLLAMAIRSFIFLMFNEEYDLCHRYEMLLLLSRY